MSRQVLERALPSNVDAERSILGAILCDNEYFYRVSERLTPEDFYLDAHRLLFRAFSAMRQESVVVDLITLQDFLLNAGNLESAGGIGYISALMEGIPHLVNVEHYAAIVKDKSQLRRLIGTASKMMGDAFDGVDTPQEILDRSEQTIIQLSSENIRNGFVSSAAMQVQTTEILNRLYLDRQLVTGVATGFTDFDRMTSGLQPQDLIVIAARPSMGKTALAMNIAAHVAVTRHIPVGVFSLEMSAQQLMLRMLCSQALVDAHKVRTGYMDHGNLDELLAALAQIAAAPLFIDDSASITLMDMRSKARRLKAEHGLGLLIVDYLGLISSTGKIENRTQEVSAVSRGLKAMAKELDIPVIALCQLSRAPEQRTGDHRPQLSDLRDSGSIEQDADMVCMLYREEVYKQDEETMGKAELIISKQRNGPIGTVRLAFLRQFTKFENLLEIG